MRSTVLYALLFLFIPCIGFAQTSQGPGGFCAAEPTPAQIAFMDAQIADFQKFLQNKAVHRSGSTMLFPIKHHIVRKSDGTGGINDADVINQINILNNYYINSNIQFYQCGPIDYVDSDQYYDFDSAVDDESAMGAQYDVPNTINVYYCNSVASNGTPVCGYAYFPGGPDRVMMVNSCTPNGLTMLHEIGHYFALYHTHGTSNFGTTDELVNGSNCTTHGDRLCDTPADPNLTGKVDFNCNYTGNEQDANGDYYMPEPANIMAYSPDACQSLFTPDQYARVEFTAINSRSYLTCSQGPCVLTTITPTDESSFGAGDGSVDLEILGSTPPYTFQWNTGDTTEDIAGLSAGKYVVTITDGDGCVQKDSAIVDYKGCSPIDVVAFVEVNASNFGEDLSWDLVRTSNGEVIARGDGLNSGVIYTDTVCLPEGETFEFITYDDNGNGWQGSRYEIRCGGNSILANNGGASPTNGVNEGSLSVETIESFTPSPCTAKDVAVIDISKPFSRCDLGQEQVELTIKNYSGLPISSFDVSVFADGGIPINESVTNVTIDYLGEYTYTFTGTIDVSGAGFHDITAFATTGSDTNRTNDTLTVTVESEPIAVSTFPYINSFEAPMDLTQVVGEDDFNWSIGTGATPTPNTGPGADNTNGSTGNYLFLESSSPNNPNKRAILQTGCVDLSALNSPYLEFYYHMNGAGINRLTVEVQTPNGWIPLWTKSGSQGPTWIEERLTLSAFLGETVKIRFVGETGANQFGDIGLDDIKVFNNVEPLQASIVSFTDALCAGAADGTAQATAVDGVPPYTFVWSNGASGTDVNSLSAGTYNVTVTDAAGQSSVATVTISEPQPLVPAILTKFDVSCNNGNDGNATAQGFGGTPPYTYLWSDGQTTASATSLTAGDYMVVVTDAQGCMDSVSINLVEPSPIQAQTTNIGHVDCFGGSEGFIKVEASGGIPPYNYSWASGATGDSIVGLNAGVYTLLVTDSNGCNFTLLDTIFEPQPIQFTVDSLVEIACAGDSNGFVSVSPFGGTGPYSIAWSTGDTTNQIFGLGSGTYSLTATDALGCTGQFSITLNEPSILSTSTTSNDATCFGCSNGSGQVNPSGGVSPYTYLWSNNSDSSAVTGLSAGVYYVTVTDARGCSKLDSVVISEPLQMTVSVSSTDVLCNGDANGTATVTVTDGVSPFSYQWSNGGTSSTITGLSSGSYTVTVVDANGNTSSGSVTITEPPLLVLQGQTTIEHIPLCDGQAGVFASGGTQPFTYQWNDPSNQTSQIATQLCAGTYTVTVTDANGCVETKTMTVGSNIGIEESAVLDFNLYPNPTQSFITVELGTQTKSKTLVQVTNNLGEVIQDLSLNPGAQSIQLNVSDLPDGVYLIYLRSDAAIGTKQFVVQH